MKQSNKAMTLMESSTDSYTQQLLAAVELLEKGYMTAFRFHEIEQNLYAAFIRKISE